ncbi:phosphatase PAP2 family protein [Pseudobacteriovorax antillogorgiicola]|uniref:Undecaprenyl-diphosphatase n=1 Tax=Pseudobacteriovorax antillogorgiicola TaxID=1513793 RepID=A0A1Y6B404_9BACT|nr:phosphatase PAP2 family protein [Pseudobacteriovorax antillogorgiicola]TCS59202.1 undecaprenyl-diphosphatase [Pseudobacteriovorax antillogorgiicola]SME90636.1 undecaprenyl-diphosphatase [Pseudobacteriovorax antillogorgiicola]
MNFGDVLNFLKSADLYLLYQVNLGWSNPALDLIMRAISSHTIWLIPLGGWAYLCIRRKQKFWWLGVLLLLIGVGLADLFAYQVLKPYFGRLRPCKVDEMVRVVHSCGGMYSFPSNHATNSMVLAGILLWWSRPLVGGVFVAISLLVGLSRVYLGVHYPLDISFGFLLGLTWASVLSLMMKRVEWVRVRMINVF